MMRPRVADKSDVIMLAVPPEFDVSDFEKVRLKFNDLAWERVRAQWSKRSRITLTNTRVDWFFTDDAEKVDEFQPAHDCETCRQGNEKAKEFLLANPGVKIAMGNVYYTENWPEYDLSDVADDEKEFVVRLLDVDARLTVENVLKLIRNARSETKGWEPI